MIFSENDNLLINIFFGLAFEIIWLIENLNSATNFKNLRPELVEKKEPPIIINIIKTKVRLSGVLSREIPIFETLLDIARNIIPKLISLSIKKKKVKTTKIK